LLIKFKGFHTIAFQFLTVGEGRMSHPYFLALVIGIAVLILFIVILLARYAYKRRLEDQHYPVSEQLYVGNLAYQVNSHQLKQLFSKFGEVETVRVIKNTKTGRSKGFAFVTYKDEKEARKALKANGQEFRGRAMVVRMAKPRQDQEVEAID
jgi:cold-inducible RNA-binding protein